LLDPEEESLSISEVFTPHLYQDCIDPRSCRQLTSLLCIWRTCSFHSSSAAIVDKIRGFIELSWSTEATRNLPRYVCFAICTWKLYLLVDSRQISGVDFEYINILSSITDTTVEIWYVLLSKTRSHHRIGAIATTLAISSLDTTQALISWRLLDETSYKSSPGVCWSGL